MKLEQKKSKVCYRQQLFSETQVMVTGDEIIADPNTIVTFQTTAGEQTVQLVQATSTAARPAPQIYVLTSWPAQQMVAANEATEITVTMPATASTPSAVVVTPVKPQTTQ